jgi:hypothetical protein
MSKLTATIFNEDGSKTLPAWLEYGRCLEHTSEKNMKNLQRSIDYYRKEFETCHSNRTDFDKIQFIYDQCKKLNEIFGLTDSNDPMYFVVDHIVPITHGDVCGLHVHWNLQIITARENSIKSNNHWPDKHQDSFFDKCDQNNCGAWLDFWVKTKHMINEPKQFLLDLSTAFEQPELC